MGDRKKKFIIENVSGLRKGEEREWVDFDGTCFPRKRAFPKNKEIVGAMFGKH